MERERAVPVPVPVPPVVEAQLATAPKYLTAVPDVRPVGTPREPPRVEQLERGFLERVSPAS